MSRAGRGDWRQWVSLLVRLGLGGVLLVAGGLKVSDPTQSALAVEAYKIFPTDLAYLIGYTLPWFEIAVGLLLVLGLMTRLAAVVTGVLMVLFIAGIISAWARGLTIDCGCFGGGGEVDAAETAYPAEIIRDTVYLAGAVWLTYFPRSAFSLDGWLATDQGTDDDAAAVVDQTDPGTATTANRTDTGQG